MVNEPSFSPFIDSGVVLSSIKVLPFSLVLTKPPANESNIAELLVELTAIAIVANKQFQLI